MPLTASLIATHTATFLFGAAVGAVGEYFALKFTDQRHRQEAARREQDAFDELASQMSGLFKALKADIELDGCAYVRDVYVLHTRGNSINLEKASFVYYRIEHSQLAEKLAMIERAGFMVDETKVGSHTPHYVLTEPLVRKLKAWTPK